jgi:peptide/nickel transport system substrate-binding protein
MERAGEPVTQVGRRAFLSLIVGLGAPTVNLRRLPSSRPRHGGVLKHIGIEPPTFDIHGPASTGTQLMSSFVRRGLFKFANGSRYGPSDFTLVPDLAQHAAVSSDGRTYTITLRRGVTWERRPPVNGRTLVATDVKYSLERALKKSPYASLLGPIDAVEASGAYTVRVHLQSPFEPFLHNLTEPWTAILAPEVEDTLGDLKSAPSLIGCGPFVLDRYERGVKAVFARNPTYYRKGLPYLDKIEWIFFENRETQLSLFRAGQIDIPLYDARITPSDAATLKGSEPPYPVVRWDRLGGRSLSMRVDKAPFNDVRVRRALSLALDRKSWVARYLGGEGFEDDGPVPSPMRQWKLKAADLGAGATYLEHDPASARRLLSEAGFPNGLRTRCTTWPGHGPEHLEALETLVSEVRRVGFDLVVGYEDYDSYARNLSQAKYGDVVWDSSPLFTEVDSYLYSLYRGGVPTNRSRVADASLDALLDAQRALAARPARKKLIDEIQRRAAAEVYYIHAPFPRSVASWSPWVKNYGPRNSLDRGAQLEVVWLEEP